MQSAGLRAGGAPLAAVEAGSGFLAGAPLFAGTVGTGALGTFLSSTGPFALALPGEGEVGRASGGFVVGGGPLGSA